MHERVVKELANILSFRIYDFILIVFVTCHHHCYNFFEVRKKRWWGLSANYQMFQQISKSANLKMFQQISVAWKGKAAAAYSSYSGQCQIRQKGRKMQKWLETGKLRVASRSRIGSQGKERGERRNKSFPVLHFAGQGPSEEEEQKQKNCNK